MRRIDLKSVGLGVLIGIGAMLGIAATGSTSRAPMEYRVVVGYVRGELESEMNRLDENWEFLATSNTGDPDAYAIFRRPKR
jgi:hypothetical protein